MGAARAMLHDQDLPFFLWVEACNTIVYNQNKNPYKVLGSKTPKEAFTWMKLDVGHLRILLALWHRFDVMAPVLSLMVTHLGDRSQFKHSERRKRHIRRFI